MSATSAPRADQAGTYLIQGREVRLPVLVRDASAGVATYLVSAAAAQRLLPAHVEVAEILPGRTIFSLAVIEYRDNDLGAYNEVSLTFFVRPRGARRGIPYVGTIAEFLRGRLGTFIHWLPVDGTFTCEAGRTIWGFPKTLEDIAIRKEPDRVVCTLTSGGRHVLTFSVPRGGARALPDTSMTTYSLIDGLLHATPFSQAGDGVGFHLGGAELTLGDHPAADELRSLGLPKRALMSMWTERMHARFEAAARVSA